MAHEREQEQEQERQEEQGEKHFGRWDVLRYLIMEGRGEDERRILAIVRT